MCLFAGPSEAAAQVSKEEVNTGADATAMLEGVNALIAKQMQAFEERRKLDMQLMQEQMQQHFQSMQQMMGAPPHPPPTPLHQAFAQQVMSTPPLATGSSIPGSYAASSMSHTHVREQRIRDLAKLQAMEESNTTGTTLPVGKW